MERWLSRVTGASALFVALVLYVFGFPYLAGSQAGRLVGGLVAAALPALTLATLRLSRWRLWVGLALGVPATVAILQVTLQQEVASSPLVQVIPTAFFAFATTLLVADVVRAPRVGPAEILRVLSGYLLLGYTWWSAYVTVELLRPGSFDAAHGAGVSAGDLLYFSVITLTTLGYGDVVPVSAQARSLAMLEALVGVLYIAVLVARLVAAYAPARS